MQRNFTSIVTITACLALTSAAHAQFGPANVVVTEVIERPVAPVQNFVATVMPLRKSVVGTAVDGRVLEFLFDEADPETKLTYVTKGQPLAKLREGTVEIKVAEAQAQRNLRQAEWEEADQTQLGLVEQATAKLKAMTESFRFNKNQFERNRQLYEGNRSISLETYEQSRTQMYLAEQMYIEAKIEEAVIKRGDRVRQAKARLDEAEAVLHEWNDRVEKYTIRAPFDGFIVAEHTEVGEWVQQGDPIADVVQLQPIEVRAFVSEKYVGQLQIGGAAVVRPSVEMADNQNIPPGKITGVVAEAVGRSRTFPVKIQVDNSNHILKAGMLAEVELEIGTKQLATLVPKDALVLGGPTTTIFLAVPDEKDPSKFVGKMMPVRQGASLGKWIAVTAVGDEIRAGDLVVEKGNERLRPNAPLMINRKGASSPPN